MSMRRGSASSLIFSKELMGSTFFISIKFFLIRESTVESGQCQVNFYLTSLRHHVIKPNNLRIYSSREAEGPTRDASATANDGANFGACYSMREMRDDYI